MSIQIDKKVLKEKNQLNDSKNLNNTKTNDKQVV